MQTARACVEEDGAEVVIPGCTLAGSILSHDVPDAEAVIGAPVLDGMITGFKMAEIMADLRAAGVPIVSRRGWLRSRPNRILPPCASSWAERFDAMRRLCELLRWTTMIHLGVLADRRPTR